MNKTKVFLKALGKQFLIIILYLFITILLQLLLQDYLTSLDNNLVGAAYLFIEIVTLLIFVIIFRKILIPDILDFKQNGKKYIKNNFKYWLFGLIIMAISNIIISSFIGLSTNESGNRDILSDLPIYGIFAMVIIAPIVEELMTRVILKDKVPDIIYYTLSALIFASLHLLSATSVSEIFYLIPYGALGFCFAIMYKKTNNVCTNIFFHMVHNLMAIILILI